METTGGSNKKYLLSCCCCTPDETARLVKTEAIVQPRVAGAGKGERSSNNFNFLVVAPLLPPQLPAGIEAAVAVEMLVAVRLRLPFSRAAV